MVRLVSETPGRDDEHEPGEHACGNLIDDALWNVDMIENALGPYHFGPLLHALVGDRAISLVIDTPPVEVSCWLCLPE